MKKLSNGGFVLAETLVVAVFLMSIFSMIYYYFYPLMGEYEKREVYDSVDDKYSVYWLKRLIEDSSYNIEGNTDLRNNFTKYQYIRFRCSDVSENDEKREMCRTLVNALQVEGCDRLGDTCSIFITKYRIGNEKDPNDFKRVVKDGQIVRHQENCREGDCEDKFKAECKENKRFADEKECNKLATKKVFNTGFQDYIESLPDYKAASLNDAKYRVIAMFQHTTDNNNYYSYATIEVRR